MAVPQMQKPAYEGERVRVTYAYALCQFKADACMLEQ